MEYKMFTAQYKENWTNCDSVLAFWVINPA